MYFYKFECADYDELQWRVLTHKEKFTEEQIKEMMIEATVWVLENDRTDGWYWEIPDGSIDEELAIEELTRISLSEGISDIKNFPFERFEEKNPVVFAGQGVLYHYSTFRDIFFATIERLVKNNNFEKISYENQIDLRSSTRIVDNYDIEDDIDDAKFLKSIRKKYWKDKKIVTIKEFAENNREKINKKISETQK